MPVQVIKNGRTGNNAKTRVVQVERKKLPCKTKPTKHTTTVQTDTTSRLQLLKTEKDGTEDRVIFTYSRHLSTAEKRALEELIDQHECSEMIHGRAWRQDDVLRITVKRKAISECGCRDIRQMMRSMLEHL